MEIQNSNSVNQLNAQIKLCEMWKVMNILNYPTRVTQLNRDDSCRTTRAKTNCQLVEKGISNVFLFF